MSSTGPSPHDTSPVTGALAGPQARKPDANGRSALGAVVADALRFGARPFGVTLAALVDPADLHADLDAEKPHEGGTPGAVTLADAPAALPLEPLGGGARPGLLHRPVDHAAPGGDPDHRGEPTPAPGSAREGATGRRYYPADPRRAAR